MSHQHVPIPLPMRPITNLSRFLFRRGKGDWVYRSVGGLMSLGDRMGDVNVFKGYTPTESDIIVACHSRSGTHWMMQIALQIAHLGQADYDYIYDVISWPDFLPGAAVDLKETPPPSPTGRRVIKTHVPAQSVPVNDLAKYIIVIRDPKEVLVSLYHWAPQAFAFIGIQSGTPDYFVEKFINNQVPGGWWAKHTASWWALRDKPNVHIVTFKDLKANPNGEIDRISEFLSVDLSPEQRLQVIEKSSFDYMKAINHKFSPIIGDTDMMEIVRKGKADTNTELFTDEHFAKVDMMCKQQLVNLGSDFPYDELFAYGVEIGCYMLDLIERSFTVSVPVEAAWEHLAMIEHWHTWATHIKRIENDSDGALNAQSKGTIHLKNGIKSTFEMREYKPHQNWKWIGPFLWMTVHYDHRFRPIADDKCEMTFHIAAEGFAVGIFGRLFASIYNRNLDVAIPNLIDELQASVSSKGV